MTIGVNSSSADLVPRDGFQEFEGEPEGWVDGHCGQLVRDPHTGRLWVKRSHEGSKLNWKEILVGVQEPPEPPEPMVGVFSGIGSPEGILAKGVGSIYSDLTDPGHPRVWLKSMGGETNTGWVPILFT